MAKPICIILWPDNYVIGGSQLSCVEIMNYLNGEENDRIKRSHSFDDYHWFCFIKHNIETPEFQVFYDNDFTDIEFGELKKLVLDNLSEMRTIQV